jgi:endo-1,4-beta-xylanase
LRLPVIFPLWNDFRLWGMQKPFFCPNMVYVAGQEGNLAQFCAAFAQGQPVPMITRRTVLAAAALSLAAQAGKAAPGALQLPRPVAPLKRRIPFGSASMIQSFRADPRYGEALVRHCDIIVPMNCLKWEQLRHDRARFDTADAEAQIAFAEANGKSVRGHALVWGLALPDWAKRISSRAEAEREMTNHIRTVVTRFKGRIPSWDVVNEAVADHPEKGEAYRPSLWQERLGPGHIDLAFRTAAAADPAAKLVINDYNLEYATVTARARRAALLAMVRRLKDKGIPIHGVGLQAHLYAEQQIDTEGLARFVSELDAMGLDILITELDVIDWRLPGPVAARDAAAARHVLAFLDTVGSAKLPSSVVTWGMSDATSWIHDTFKRDDGLRARPLPFDESFRPKPMWQAIESFCAARA